MDLEKIEELISLMRRSGVTQLSLELPDCKVSITRAVDQDAPAGATASAAARSASSPLPASTAAQADPLPVTSPVVGLFRNGSGSRGGAPVVPGDRVKRGMLLATIEAMKVPNEVRSPVDGVVSAVFVEDAATVEYGQMLFAVEPEEGGETDEGETPVGLA